MKRTLLTLLGLPLACVVTILISKAYASCTSTTPNLGLANCTIGTARSISDPAWINNFLLLDLGFTSPLSISGVGSASPTVSLGTVAEAKGGTNQTTYTTGDTLYASAANTLSKLNGNTSATRKFRQQHGNGSTVTSNTWDVLTEPDLPATRISAITQFSNSLCADNEVPLKTAGAWACGTFAGPGDISDVWTCTTGNCNALTAASGDTLDASNADSTAPNKKGTSAPGTCSIGMTFFDTDATAGQNIYGCTATNTWTLEGDGAGGGTPAGSNTQVQFNNSSAFGGASGITYDTTNSRTVISRTTGSGLTPANGIGILSITGAVSDTSGDQRGISFVITGRNGNGGSFSGQYLGFLEGVSQDTGGQPVTGLYVEQEQRGSEVSSANIASAGDAAVRGVMVQNTNTTASVSTTGVVGSSGAANGTGAYNFGGRFIAQHSVSGPMIGVLGVASGSTEEANWKNVALYGTLVANNTPIVAANNISAAMVLDNGVQAAPIAVFLDNGAEVARIDDGGAIKSTAANGSTRSYTSASELITLSTSGTTTDSSANLLPADSLIEAVACRVTTTITTATDWSIGDGTTAARFSSANATLTAGTTSVGLNHMKGGVATDAAGPTQAAAAKLRITTTGTPGAGVIRCTVWAKSFTAPTS